MTGQITVTGMVLSSMPVGDYDKRIVILTKERGRISCFARGSRKPNSPHLACTQPFSFGEFTVYAGKSSYNLVSAEISNYFSELRDDIAMIYHGMYFCELAEYFTKEGDDEKETLKLLYQSLRALSKPAIGIRLVRAVFEMKIIIINGFGPQVFECVSCGNNECVKEQGIHVFASHAGGLVCRKCAHRAGNIKHISHTALYTLQYITSTPAEKLFSFTLSGEILEELIAVSDEYTKVYVEKKMNSLEMLDVLSI